MRKRELEKTLRAASRLSREMEFYLIGSQAVHAYCKFVPAEVLLSEECDIYPKNRPETANLIDAELGRKSRFARQNGFYADVVTPEIASLPAGWQRRLKPLRAGRVIAWCLDIHDLIVSKLAAGRLKDFEFVSALFHAKLADQRIIQKRINEFPIERDHAMLRARLQTVLDDLHRSRRG